MKHNIIGLIACLTILISSIAVNAQSNARAKKEFTNLLMSNVQDWEITNLTGDTIFKYSNYQFFIAKDSLKVKHTLTQIVLGKTEYTCQRRLSFPLTAINDIALTRGHQYYATQSYLCMINFSGMNGKVLEKCPKSDALTDDTYLLSDFSFGIKANHLNNLQGKLNALVPKINPTKQ